MSLSPRQQELALGSILGESKNLVCHSNCLLPIYNSCGSFPYKNGYVRHMCFTSGAMNAARVPYAISAEHVQDSITPHICATCMLLVCMLLQPYLILYATCMLLVYMHTTSIPHMCSLHTCVLLQHCIHAV